MPIGSRNSSRRISPGWTAQPAGPSFLILTIASPTSDLMVIRYLHVVGVAIPPHEAHSELVIDGNTVLAFPVMVQFFQPVAARNPQILQSGGGVEHGQLLPGRFS